MDLLLLANHLNFTFSIYSTCMVHILQEMAHWQHGIHRGWRNHIIKQGLHSSGAQEREVELGGAMHS